MKAPCFDSMGKRSGDIDLPQALFGAQANSALVHQVIEAERANRHQGSHKVKERNEVSGGGRKPWKQKGTGNARQGSTRAPQWRGGGTIFGPRVRSYHLGLPKKMRRAGMRALLASRAREGVISVLRGFALSEYDTKKAYGVFKQMELMPHSTVVFIVNSDDAKMHKSFANIRNIQVVHVKRLTAPEVFYAGKLVLSDTALAYLTEHYQGASPHEKKTKVA